MLGRAQLGALDADLCERARCEGALRLRLGQLLEALGRGGHHELGFSSLAAYSLERCARSVRWVEGARCLARRLEALPEVRCALSFGLISWSMAEPLSRLVTAGQSTTEPAAAEPATAERAMAESEARWLVVARHLTVRQVRELLKVPLAGEANDEGSSAVDAYRTLILTIDREDSWLLEATRTLLAQLGASTASDQVEALLAEGLESLLRALPDGALDTERLERDDQAQRGWRDQLAHFREEAERRCESQLPRQYQGDADADAGAGVADPGRGASQVGALQVGGPHAEQAAQAASGGAALASMAPGALDAKVRELSRLLASHELELSHRLLEFHRADGWRRLGYATEAQYARERLGMSRGSMLAKRALALRLRPLPRVTAAMASGQLGVEAATQLSLVATPLTEAEWLERARHRTVKHLREEVAASLTAVRLSGARDCPPPLPEEIERFFDLERAVVGGQLGDAQLANGRAVSDAELASRFPSSGGAPGEVRPSDSAQRARRPWPAMLKSLGEWLAGGWLAAGSLAGGSLPGGLGGAVQMSAARPLAGVGRVRLRLRVASELADGWRGLEAQARRWLPRGMSWVRFVCLSVWRGWQHLLGVAVAYGGIYVRDRHRCTSPVCNRRDVTPHHLRYRSAGGGEEPDNLAAVCSWCHLLGIHEQRIRAVGTAGRVRWELGRDQPCLVVEGRDRLTA